MSRALPGSCHLGICCFPPVQRASTLSLIVWISSGKHGAHHVPAWPRRPPRLLRTEDHQTREEKPYREYCRTDRAQHEQQRGIVKELKLTLAHHSSQPATDSARHTTLKARASATCVLTSARFSARSDAVGAHRNVPEAEATSGTPTASRATALRSRAVE